MHFDSSKLTFSPLTNVLITGFIAQQAPADDSSDADGDASTDKYVLVAWADQSGQWPGQLPSRLFTANFTLMAASRSTSVNFTASSKAAGWTFAATSAVITVGDASCGPVTTTADSDAGSLRQAILCANETPGTQTIEFNIPGGGAFQIQPTSSLPTITDPMVIDATTQPGYAGTPLIELDGSLAGAGVNGLRITSGGSIVRGLVVNRFAGSGIASSRIRCSRTPPSGSTWATTGRPPTTWTIRTRARTRCRTIPS
jgi:hypothetical protein